MFSDFSTSGPAPAEARAASSPPAPQGQCRAQIASFRDLEGLRVPYPGSMWT